MNTFTRFTRKIISTIVSCLVIVLITLGLMEFVGQKVIRDEMLMFVDNVDHRMKPDPKHDINQDGIRSKRGAEAFHDKDFNIIFLGDSFVYGLMLDYDDTIPHRLEVALRDYKKRKDIKVANFGWVTSSPLLSYRLLKDIGKSYKPDLVILGVDMTDFSDDVKYQKMLDRKGVYKMSDYFPAAFVVIHKIISSLDILSGMHEVIFGFPSKRFFITEQPLSQSGKYLPYIEKNIEDIKNYSRDVLHADFVLTVFPRGYQYSMNESPKNWEKDEYELMGKYSLEPFRYLKMIQKRADFPVLSLLPSFQDSDTFPTCFDWDPHYNKEGAQIAVDGIRDFLLKDEVLSRKLSE